MTTRRLALSLAVLAAACAASGRAEAQKVLLIADDDPAGTAVLKGALEAGGMAVTQTGLPCWQYDGSNPAPAGYDVIVLLAGTANARTNDMPGGGQTAIKNFVAGGGGLVATEWAAFHVSAGRWQTLKPLVLLSRNAGTIGLIDMTVDMNFQGHPLWNKLPASFSVSMGTNVGTVVPGPGVVRLAISAAAGDAVVFRDLVNTGRIVELSTAGNYTNGTWANGNLQQLLVNAAQWASKSRTNRPPVADPGGPYVVNEGGAIKLKGNCTDPDGDSTTPTWDLDGNGVFADATGPEPTFDATMLDGPQAIAIGLRCTDTGALFDDKTVMLTVNNVAPSISTMPPTTASEGVLYDYAATVVEPYGGDDPQCTLLAGPMGMSVAARSCRVQWLPTYDQARKGVYMVTVVVTDKDGGSTMQSWAITASVIDADKDSLPDTWEKMWFGDLAQTAGGDPDGDGRPNLKEYQDGSDPNRYDGPDAPTIVGPDGGIHTVRKPLLTVGNAKSPTGDALVYTFETYSDPQLQQLVDVNLTVLEGQNGVTTYTPPTLAENAHHYFRVRARDPYIAGPWSKVGHFFADEVHEAPTAPRALMPLNQSKIKNVSVKLEVQNAHSPDELRLTYTFEIYGDEGLMARVESQDQVPEGMGSTIYSVKAQLTPYTRYFWRARATDEKGLEGPWSEVSSFMITPTNPPPAPPNFKSPLEGARVPTTQPTFTFGGSSDPDEEPIAYLCEIDVGVEFSSPKLEKSMAIPTPMQDPLGDVTWSPRGQLDENQRYCVRCRAQDTSGTSGWSQLCFRVDVRNDPPTVPVLMNPSNGGSTTGDVVRFTWVNSMDPENDAIKYDVEIFFDEALSRRVLRGEGDDGPTGATLVGVPGGELWWHARAVDVLGAASEWSKANKFTSTATGTGGPGDDGMGGGCGCRVGAARTGPGRAVVFLLVFGVLGGWVVRRRRRVR